MRRTLQNIIFLFVNQLFTYIFPLITLPILVNSLGAGGFGRISFALAFISYFILIVDYGFNITASRKIAQCKNNPKESYQVFLTTIYSKLFLAAISAVIMFIITSFIPFFKDDRLLFWTFYFAIIGLALFPQWYFQGIEKMGNITLINSLSKIIYTVLIIFFIKKDSDIFWVGVFYSLSYIIPGVWAFLIAKKIQVNESIPRIEKIRFKDVILELTDGKYVFLSSIMSSVLLSTSVIVLGFFASHEIVGIYSALDKIIKAAVFFFTPITVAIFPIISNEMIKSERNGIKSILKFGIPTVVLSIMLMFGFFFAKDLIISFIYPDSFLPFSSIFVILSIWIPFSVINNFIGIQYLCGSGNSSIYGKSFTISGILTIILMIIMTKEFSYNGTAYSVLIGEIILSFAMIVGIIFFKRKNTVKF